MDLLQSLLYWGAQQSTQPADVVRREEGSPPSTFWQYSSITAQGPLALLAAMTNLCVMVTWCLPWTLWFWLCPALFQLVGTCSGAWGCSLAHAGMYFYFHVLSFMRFLSIHFSILLRSLWMAAWLFHVSITSSSFVSLGNLWRVTVKSSLSVKQVLNDPCANITPLLHPQWPTSDHRTLILAWVVWDLQCCSFRRHESNSSPCCGPKSVNVSLVVWGFFSFFQQLKLELLFQLQWPLATSAMFVLSGPVLLTHHLPAGSSPIPRQSLQSLSASHTGQLAWLSSLSFLKILYPSTVTLQPSSLSHHSSVIPMRLCLTRFLLQIGYFFLH